VKNFGLNLQKFTAVLEPTSDYFLADKNHTVKTQELSFDLLPNETNHISIIYHPRSLVQSSSCLLKIKSDLIGTATYLLEVRFINDIIH
jgi:hypothetical protein